MNDTKHIWSWNSHACVTYVYPRNVPLFAPAENESPPAGRYNAEPTIVMIFDTNFRKRFPATPAIRLKYSSNNRPKDSQTFRLQAPYCHVKLREFGSIGMETAGAADGHFATIWVELSMKCVGAGGGKFANICANYHVSNVAM